MNPFLLLTTGPVPLSDDVRKALSRPVLYHRNEDFVNIFNRVQENLKYFLQTQNDVLLLTSSGTGGMEAAIANLFSRGEDIIVVENGKFSERWSQIGKAYGLKIHPVKIPWGQSVHLEQIKECLHKVRNPKGVFLTHCESSTGALTDIEFLVPEIRKITPALVIVDAISTAGVLPLKTDSWQIDVLVTASQKGLGLPPGLAIVALNNRAWRRAELANLPRFYFDFSKARQAMCLNRGAAFTPPIPIVVAADVVLQMIKARGLKKIWEKRAALARTIREWTREYGLTIFPSEPADSITAIKTSPARSANHIISQLKEKHQIVVSRGQGKLNDKIFRIGHMVDLEKVDIDRFFRALETILQEYE